NWPADRVRDGLVARLVTRSAGRVGNRDLVLLRAGPVRHILMLAVAGLVDRLAHRVGHLGLVPLGDRLTDRVALFAVAGLVARPQAGVALLLHDRVIDGAVANLGVCLGDRQIADAILDLRQTPLVGAADGRSTGIRADAAVRGPRFAGGQ